MTKTDIYHEWLDQYGDERLGDMLSALNWSYYHGLEGHEAREYWTEAEPLEHYTWKSFPETLADANSVLQGLPKEYYWWDEKAIFIGPYELQGYFIGADGDWVFQSEFDTFDEFENAALAISAEIEIDEHDMPDHVATLSDIIRGQYRYLLEILDF